MTTPISFVPTAEAAFIAGVSDRDMNRAIDEHILPDALFRIDEGRWFARLGAAFAGFFFGTEDFLVAAFRRKLLVDLTMRLDKRVDKDRVLALAINPRELDWLVNIPNLQVDVESFIRASWERAQAVERANAMIKSDAAIMGGADVFEGTRVPYEIVLASLDAGIDKQRVRQSYPFLTDEHVDAARIYARIHPRRGRPRTISETHPSWKVKSNSVVRRSAKA